MSTSPDTPAADPVGTVRVHPDDDPQARDARRYVLTDDLGNGAPARATPWDLLTGNRRPETTSISELSKGHADLVGWPRQSLWSLAVALGHRASRADAPAVDRVKPWRRPVGTAVTSPPESGSAGG